MMTTIHEFSAETLNPHFGELSKALSQVDQPALEESRHKRYQLKQTLEETKHSLYRAKEALKKAKHEWRIAAVAHEEARRKLEAYNDSRRIFESDLGYSFACALGIFAEDVSMPETHDGWWIRILSGYYDRGAYAALLTRDGQIRICRPRRDEVGSLALRKREARQLLDPPLGLITTKALSRDTSCTLTP